ncbi:MAG: hypothetical protein ABH833_01500 [Parcubacteria group bacterium]
MTNETKNCQNCKKDFAIESDDFAFYEKMKVPAPTFCPQCRFQRRLMFRNEQVLYKRKCDLCGKDMVSLFHPEKKDTIVYCQPCWWSDKWDPFEYGRDYDPSRSIFDQMKDIQKEIPHMTLFTEYLTLVNSDYVNHAGSCKNSYLIFNAEDNENLYYAAIAVNVKDSADCYMIGESELCYEAINCGRSYNIFFSEGIGDCTDIYFSKALDGCTHCFGCINLRKKSYHIFNEPYSKEEYFKKLEEYKFDSYQSIMKMQKEARKFWIKFSHRFVNASPQNINSTGDYVYNAKNAKDCYQARFIEDSRYCQFITTKPEKDCYDHTEWGKGAQRVIDSITVGDGADSVKYCFGSWDQNTMNTEYCMYVNSCNNMFASMNMRKQSYCILNKKYSKEEYKKLRDQIVKDMNEKPYIDSKGRVWKYGDFFPYDLSLFGYNETLAIYYWPLTEECALEKGWSWREKEISKHKVTLPPDQVPDSIKDVQDSILNEIMECGACNNPYRLVNGELKLLRRFNLPIPRNCYDCRYATRMARVNPPRLWGRKCDKCRVEVQTSYAPERPEMIYCKDCYQAEIV